MPALEGVHHTPRRSEALARYRLQSPISAALARVLKLSMKPTTAAEVSASTGSASTPTACRVKR